MNKLILVIAIAFGMSNTSLFAEDKAKPEVAKKEAVQSVDTMLTQTIGDYMAEWSKAKPDYKSMYAFENWQDGEKLSEIEYIQGFDTDFQVKEYKVTKITPKENGEYEALVWVRHTISKNVPAFIPRNKLVRSTLRQWWKKIDDKFVHLYHVEKQQLAKMFSTKDILNKIPQKPTAPETN